MTTNFLSAVIRPLARAVRRATFRRLALAALGAAPLAVPLSVLAQPPQLPLAASAPTVNKTFWKSNIFTMPVSIDNNARSSLREVQLFVKDHPSRPWVLKDTAPPTTTGFSFRPPQDGEYWFTVVTVDKLGRATPPDLNAPGVGVVVVVVDTQPPQLNLRPQPPISNGQVVECVVCDANPDPGRTKFEYQTGDKNWRTAEMVPGYPEAYLVPMQAVTTGLVRATVLDRAGNSTFREMNLSNTITGLVVDNNAKQPAQQGIATMVPTGEQNSVAQVGIQEVPVQPPQPAAISAQVVNSSNIQPLDTGDGTPHKSSAAPSNIGPQPPRPVAPPKNPTKIVRVETPTGPASKTGPGSAPVAGTPTGRRLINQTQVSLEYQVDEVGPSGIGKVDVYLTSDMGQSWRKLCEDADRKSPVQVDLPGEGLFGITLVVSNGRGFGATPPRPGETPNWWIEVDLTRPTVELTSVQPSEDAKSMVIQWNASDKNLGDGPVDLFYAINRDGPWTPIARGVKNDGRYHWNVPQVAPQAYVRVVVSDRAGNVHQCETTNPVVLDQSHPRATVVNMTVPGSQPVAPAGH